MITDSRKFYTGIGLMTSFMVVFILFFSPILNGQNGLEYLDDLYNSISKGSAYYIPKINEEAAALNGKIISLSLNMATAEQAKQTAKLFSQGSAAVSISGTVLTIRGDLGKMLAACLADADLMYLNHGDKLVNKYNYPEKQVLYNWWAAAKLMDKELSKQKLFKEAGIVSTVMKKGIETSYNYYTIEPQSISDKWGIVIFSLIFYVIYTIWYGFAIMYLFEGMGMQLGH